MVQSILGWRLRFGFSRCNPESLNATAGSGLAETHELPLLGAFEGSLQTIVSNQRCSCVASARRLQEDQTQAPFKPSTHAHNSDVAQLLHCSRLLHKTKKLMRVEVLP
jgi:hypothetical protein